MKNWLYDVYSLPVALGGETLSDDPSTLIDDEVRKLVESQYQRAKDLLTERKNELEILANALLEKEVLLKSDVERLVGKRPHGEEEITFTPHEEVDTSEEPESSEV